MKIKTTANTILGLAFGLVTSLPAGADEGGVSYWLPITAGPDSRADPLFPFPGYTFETPAAGARTSLAVGAALAHTQASVQASLTGPRGNTIAGAGTGRLTGVSNVYALGTLKWNRGMHNTIAYAMSALPAGSYRVGRLANFGLNHWLLDLGGGYTYLDPNKGQEVSAVAGFTYNFKNDDTDYKNGVNSHLDWAASQFVSKQTHLGVAGYFYYQLTGDSGAGARSGDRKSRVTGLGPQVGHFFKVDGRTWYVNVKGYYEFDAKNRPEGWNLWVTLAIPLGPG